MSSNIAETFEKIKDSWKNEAKTVEYGELSKKALFELAYHESNEVPFRCIKVIVKPGDDEAGNIAVIWSSLNKEFIEIDGQDQNVKITMWLKDASEGFGRLEKIITNLQSRINEFKQRSDSLQDQILKTILVERKLDEVVNLAMNKDLSRKVYFAIGEARERGALIPLIMKAPKADVVQLAIMKWMNTTLNEPQDSPFPEAKVKGIVKNFLKLKEWLMNLINRSFTASEEELLPPDEKVAED